MKREMLLSALLVFPIGACATPRPVQPTTTRVAFLYGYTLEPGRRKQFVKGYRRHLQWHEKHHDPLPWYGWFVASGDRLGMFIDGSFGIPFSAFDHRVDPQGDHADAVRNVLPYVQPVFRSAYVLQPDLGTGKPLENRQPSKSVQVFYYTLRAGTAAQFETAVRAAGRHLRNTPDAPPHTWYRRAEGGTLPVYMLMVAREDWASYGRHRKTLAQRAGPDEAGHLEASVKRVRSEIWRYRPDLSLLPDRNGD